MKAAGGVINRNQILNIVKGVVRSNNPNALKEFGGSLDLTDRWARDVLKQLKWSKRKGTTGKVESPPQVLAEEKFTFQRTISTAILEHNIPAPLAVNLDKTPLSYVSLGKYIFSFKGVKNVPIKGVDDKRRISATFVVFLTGKFLPIELFYKGKSTPYQSLNFQARSHLVTQKITDLTPENQLSFSSKLSFHISRWLKEKMDTQKNSTLLKSWTVSKVRITIG